VTALFLVVVLALLGAALMNVFGLQQAASGLDLQGSRALRAARAGIEWGMYQVLVVQGGSACPASPQNLSFGGTLSAFTVTVECSAHPADETGHTPNPFNVFSLISTACNEPVAGACPNATGPSARYVERQVQATFTP
jgi:MSHA biogenesis protein MshP